ncbi:hypothetical protein NE237_012554 [Protea cynaroides]|uniref:Cytochrome P450 n=1 Tax=Protea cynaroides TaxID=273540 RepID=A0A9Q0JXQ6_9MAGN|nr:hypothetical protein NE237_012554 [Protea cynaroides]
MDDLLLLSLPIVALIFFYYFSHKTKHMSPQAPEASGAWPIIGHLPLLNPQVPLARSLATIADKYGPIFMLHIGYNRSVCVNNLEMIKDCFTHDKVFATRPPTSAGKYLGYNYAFITLGPHGPYWHEIKKMMTLELLSKSRLDMLKHIRAGEVDTSIKNCTHIGPRTRV